MIIRVKTLIAATALATLSATCAYAGGSDYGSWGDDFYQNGAGSNVINGQVTLQTQWSNLNSTIDTVGGDAALQGAAAGNMVEIMTMNNTVVDSKQYVGSDAAIGSNINADMNNIWGSVGIQNQAICNGASVSTDPVLTAVRSKQECAASDPASSINTNITNIGGNAALMGSSMGNVFEADSNADHMPIFNNQINHSIGASTINANVFNIGGSTSMVSSAVGNRAQILHYSTNN